MQSPDTAVADRFQLVEVPRGKGVASFADDVAAGLGGRRKRLPSKYLYDRVGSALFDAIMHLPQYYLSSAETEILRESGWQIVRVLDEPIDFLELGSGSAVKTRLLIAEALRVQGSMRYSPIDISIEALRAASLALVEAFPGSRCAHTRAITSTCWLRARSISIAGSWRCTWGRTSGTTNPRKRATC